MASLKVDLCVVGAGAAGLSVAAGASQLGARTVLVERGVMGGDCLNYGCVPSKALLAAAERAILHRTAAPFGLEAPPPRVDFAGVMNHLRGVIAAIAPTDSEARFEALGVTVIKAEARFLSPRTLIAGDTTVEAKRFVLATGGRAVVPPIPGLDSVPYLTNRTIFDLAEQPRHLVVLGGGPIGCELAQAFVRLGSAVTLVEARSLLPRDDAELTALVRKSLLADGVALQEGKMALAVRPAEDGLVVEVEGGEGRESLTGSHLLVAVGRRADYAGLELEKAGVACSDGRLVLDHRLRTSNRRIYAVGDAAGGLQLTHLAGAHAGVVLKSALFRLPARADRLVVPWVTYTDPELAYVGLSEEEAAARFGRISVLRWPFHENDRAQTERATGGHIKVIATPRGRVLGAGIVGRRAGELILPWVLAVGSGIRLARLASAIVPYPTLSEVSKRAAGSFYAPKLFSPRTRRLVRLLLRLP